MAHIRFKIESDCDTKEPSRFVPAIHGEIFEYLDNADDDCKIGEILAFLVLRSRAIDEN